MANLISVGLTISSADLLLSSAYGSGALLRLESASSESGSYAEIATTAIVSGTESYEIWHGAGTSTTWYRHRVSNAAGSLVSGYSAAFQVDSNQYVTLDVVKDRLKLTNSDDDARLSRLLAAAQRFMSGRITMFLGPSTDTSRTYDGFDAFEGRLFIPGGIRSFSLIEVADATGSDFESLTAGDVVLRPKAQHLAPGEPPSWLVFTDNPTGSWNDWPPGFDNIRITGAFGWSQVPEDLAELAAKLTARMWLARAAGQTDTVGTDALGNAVVSRFMARTDYQTLDSYRDRVYARAA